MQTTGEEVRQEDGVAPVAPVPAEEALVPHERRAAKEERDLHPVRRCQVVPVRGRARAVVDPRGVPRPAAANPDDDAGAGAGAEADAVSEDNRAETSSARINGTRG